MLAALRKRREREDEGFTLIELMVVVLIIGILLAIAVPTFLNAQNNAKTKAATSNARTALSAIKTVYTDTQSYDDVNMDVAELADAEPSLGWQDAASASPDQISVDFSNAEPGTLGAIAVMSKLGDCFYILDNVAAGGGTTYGRVDKADTPVCSGAALMADNTLAAAASPADADW